MLANHGNNLTCSSPFAATTYPVSWRSDGDYKTSPYCNESSAERISYCREEQDRVTHVRFNVVLLSDSGRVFTCSTFFPWSGNRLGEKQSQLFVTQSYHSKGKAKYNTRDLDEYENLRGRWIRVSCGARRPNEVDLFLDWKCSGNDKQSVSRNKTLKRPFQRSQPSWRRNGDVWSTLFVPEQDIRDHEGSYVCMATMSVSSEETVLIRKVRISAELSHS